MVDREIADEDRAVRTARRVERLACDEIGPTLGTRIPNKIRVDFEDGTCESIICEAASAASGKCTTVGPKLTHSCWIHPE